MTLGFDLNLVRTFVLLYESRSVTLTAESLHVTQPTVSYNLGKLRRQFDDELFRRQGRTLVPTSSAERLYPPLRQALGEIDETVSGTRSFRPETAHAQFTIAMTDLGEVALLPRLIAAARERAPGVSFEVRPLDVASVEEQLGKGDLDAFVATPVITSNRIARTPLFGERYVGLVSTDHPRVVGHTMTLEELASEHHVTVVGPSGHDAPSALLETYGLLDRVVLRVSRFSVLPYLVQHTDLVTIVPEFVAEVFTQRRAVRAVQLPMETDPIEIAVYARYASARSPAQQWLVDFLCEVLGERVSPAQLPARVAPPIVPT